MAFENLRNQHPLLLQYLTDHHYSTPLIDTVRREIARIIDLSDVEGWESYADILNEYEKNGWKKKSIDAHQFRHAKASHWLEDGMNIDQISFLLGHKQIETTMVYLDITQEDEVKALATIESESDSKVTKKWRNPDGSLLEFCGISIKLSRWRYRMKNTLRT